MSYYIFVACRTERVARKLPTFLASYQTSFPAHNLDTFEWHYVGVKDIKIIMPDEQTFDNMVSALEKTYAIFSKLTRKPWDAWECDEFGHIIEG